jgi:uncharacterized membrane protein
MNDERSNRRGGNNYEHLKRNLLLMTTGGILLATLFVLIGIWRTGTRFVGELNSMFNPSPATPQVDVRSVVVVKSECQRTNHRRLYNGSSRPHQSR